MTVKAKEIAKHFQVLARTGKIDIAKHCFDYADRTNSVSAIMAAIQKMDRIGFTKSSIDGQPSAQVIGNGLRLVVRQHKAKPGWLIVVSAIPLDRECWIERTQEVRNAA
jgi:hypothetical protein